MNCLRCPRHASLNPWSRCALNRVRAALSPQAAAAPGGGGGVPAKGKQQGCCPHICLSCTQAQLLGVKVYAVDCSLIFYKRLPPPEAWQEECPSDSEEDEGQGKRATFLIDHEHLLPDPSSPSPSSGIF
ncbi:hypothetical protein GH733_011911 [Mirounga leonina]|nr:hypothetical protein GH733_011911 [Mirounga leonina]